MAATDRRNPNLDDFVGLNWSCWVDKVNVLTSDDNSKYGSFHSETMTLSKEDMHIYGHCPAQDEIYLVVCSLCGHVIKPQAFEEHCDRWHSPLNTSCGLSPGLAHRQGPRPGPSLLNLSSSKETMANGRYNEGSSSRTSLPVHQRQPTKSRKENPGCEGMSERMMKLTSVGQSRTSPYGRTHENSDKEKHDLNELRKGLDPEKKQKPRSKEPVTNLPVGRTKVIGQPAGQTRSPEEQSADRHLIRSKVMDQNLEEKSTAGGSKDNSYHRISSRPRDPPQSCPEDGGDGTVEVELQLPYPFNQSLLTAQEGRGDKEQEVPHVSWHPRPLGVCTFGCRTVGCKIFIFDRRWQHLQFALGAMLEQHVKSHL